MNNDIVLCVCVFVCIRPYTLTPPRNAVAFNYQSFNERALLPEWSPFINRIRISLESLIAVALGVIVKNGAD